MILILSRVFCVWNDDYQSFFLSVRFIYTELNFFFSIWWIVNEQDSYQLNIEKYDCFGEWFSLILYWLHNLQPTAPSICPGVLLLVYPLDGCIIYYVVCWRISSFKFKKSIKEKPVYWCLALEESLASVFLMYAIGWCSIQWNQSMIWTSMTCDFGKIEPHLSEEWSIGHRNLEI